MLSVKGTFDGKSLKLSRELKITKPREVIVTFLDEEEDINQEIMYLADKGGAFDFLKDDEEDIYSDENLKKKYNWNEE